MGVLSTILYPLCLRQTRLKRNSWTTGSTCFAAVWMWPPTHPNACALSPTHLPLPYPSSQLWLSASGTRGTSMTTGQRLVLLCLTMPNCKQLQMEFVRHTMLAWSMYIKYMSSPTPQTCCLTMDVSHHLGQHLSLSICKVLVPWLQHHPDNTTHFHHITDGVDLEDHQLMHILTTSTCIKMGSAPVISANFVRCGAVTWMLDGWNSLFWSKKYISSNFLTLYQRKDTPLVLTHVNSGLWMCKVGHSHSLTARLAQCTTGHAPIRAFQSRFFPEESTGAVSPWKLCHMSCTSACLTFRNQDPENSCVMCGCSNS
jgi:hypothetical protein